MVGQGTQSASHEYVVGPDTSTAPTVDGCTITFTIDPVKLSVDKAEAEAKRRQENIEHERKVWQERRKALRKLSKIS